jgi:RNA 3'-terminal phosphate cyclase (ATP)
MLSIDGSAGEGGGQILRSSLALSMITGKSFEMKHIRAGRAKPGLLRQHLTAIQAAQEICQAEVDGGELGSPSLQFRPGHVRPGNYQFSVGSAGSANLVIQTIVPALMQARGPSEVTVEGGTHNPFSPPFDFLAKTFFPLINRLGPTITLKLEKYGFYPAGGGKLVVRIDPVDKLKGLSLVDRGDKLSTKVTALVANLPKSIGEREIAVVLRTLNLEVEDGSVRPVPSAGPGNVIMIELAFAHLTEVFTGFGEKGTRSETVAQDLVREVQRYLVSGAATDEYLADQLLLPLALAGEGAFSTSNVTPHTRTNLEVLKAWLGVSFDLSARDENWIIAKR